MWVVVALPPLTLESTTPIPQACPRCKRAGTFKAHQEITRRVPFVNVDAVGSRWPAEYATWKLRCSVCAKTSTAGYPGRRKGSIVPQYVEALAVFLRCLGFGAERMRLQFASHEGILISRTTLWRVLNRAGGSTLREMPELHPVAPSFAHTLTLPSAELESTMKAAMYNLLAIRKTPAIRMTTVLRYPVFVLRLYGNHNTKRTITWLKTYLSSIECAGLFCYLDKSSLERDFNAHDEFYEKLTFEESMAYTLLGGKVMTPVDRTWPLLQRTVRVILRYIDAVGPDRYIDDEDVYNFRRKGYNRDAKVYPTLNERTVRETLRSMAASVRDDMTQKKVGRD